MGPTRIWAGEGIQYCPSTRLLPTSLELLELVSTVVGGPMWRATVTPLSISVVLVGFGQLGTLLDVELEGCDVKGYLEMRGACPGGPRDKIMESSPST